MKYVPLYNINKIETYFNYYEKNIKGYNNNFDFYYVPYDKYTIVADEDNNLFIQHPSFVDDKERACNMEWYYDEDCTIRYKYIESGGSTPADSKNVKMFNIQNGRLFLRYPGNDNDEDIVKITLNYHKGLKNGLTNKIIKLSNPTETDSFNFIILNPSFEYYCTVPFNTNSMYQFSYYIVIANSTPRGYIPVWVFDYVNKTLSLSTQFNDSVSLVFNREWQPPSIGARWKYFIKRRINSLMNIDLNEVQNQDDILMTKNDLYKIKFYFKNSDNKYEEIFLNFSSKIIEEKINNILTYKIHIQVENPPTTEIYLAVI